MSNAPPRIIHISGTATHALFSCLQCSDYAEEYAIDNAEGAMQAISNHVYVKHPRAYDAFMDQVAHEKQQAMLVKRK